VEVEASSSLLLLVEALGFNIRTGPLSINRRLREDGNEAEAIASCAKCCRKSFEDPGGDLKEDPAPELRFGVIKRREGVLLKDLFEVEDDAEDAEEGCW
jgi:hypothetical protein